jgi:hypothetical protein
MDWFIQICKILGASNEFHLAYNTKKISGRNTSLGQRNGNKTTHSHSIDIKKDRIITGGNSQWKHQQSCISSDNCLDSSGNLAPLYLRNESSLDI